MPLLKTLLLRLFAGLTLSWAGAAVCQQPAPITLDAALAVTLAAPTDTPPEPERMTPVGLPDEWSGSIDALAQPARWYRLAFDAPAAAPGTLFGAHIARACSNLEVHLNGVLVHRAGTLDKPFTRSCFHSRLVSLPSALLRPRDNRLDIQVVGQPLSRVAARERAGGLSAVTVGAYAALVERHESQLFWSVTLTQIVAAMLVMIGVILFALAWVRRLPYLVYFALVTIGWAVLSARIWWRSIALDGARLELLTCSLGVPLAVCGVLFLLRYCGVHKRRLEVLLWSQCLIVPIGLLAAGPGRLFMAASAVYTVLAIEVFAAVGFFLAHAWRTRRAEFWLMGSLLAFLGLAVGSEMAVQDGLLQLPQIQLTHLAIPLLFFALALRLVQTFAHTLASVEDARHQLEQRVQQISADIERNFAHLAEVRVEQVAEKERKRIAADLHDDLGAKLLTIVHTSDNERISTLAREALEEMRLSVRGIAGKPVQLADALADWRAETVSRLGDAGIEIEWSSAEPQELRTLAARSYVQTTRVLREATSNLIKHSGASRAVISCTVGDDFRLVIRDNGRGIPLELDGKLDRGHGMASMKHRAKQMQGQCLVESGPGYGTVIRLTLPL